MTARVANYCGSPINSRRRLGDSGCLTWIARVGGMRFSYRCLFGAAAEPHNRNKIRTAMPLESKQRCCQRPGLPHNLGVLGGDLIGHSGRLGHGLGI